MCKHVSTINSRKTVKFWEDYEEDKDDFSNSIRTDSDMKDNSMEEDLIAGN